jgi:hypothetical protein
VKEDTSSGMIIQIQSKEKVATGEEDDNWDMKLTIIELNVLKDMQQVDTAKKTSRR